MQSPEERLVWHLVSELPELGPVLDKHLEDEEGELLPHVLFGDVTRWAVAQDSRSFALARLLGILDEAYAAGPVEVVNLVTVSFVEDLPEESPVWRRLSPRLAAALS
jgi:hypothetical protein